MAAHYKIILMADRCLTYKHLTQRNILLKHIYIYIYSKQFQWQYRGYRVKFVDLFNSSRTCYKTILSLEALAVSSGISRGRQ